MLEAPLQTSCCGMRKYLVAAVQKCCATTYSFIIVYVRSDLSRAVSLVGVSFVAEVDVRCDEPIAWAQQTRVVHIDVENWGTEIWPL